jgi:D-amino-acid dehydrogenase
VDSDGRRATVTLRTEAGEEPHHFDAMVVCAGVGSRALAAQLGDRVNIYPVKGYSITVNLLDEQSQRAAPTVSLLDDETKLVTSRLGRTASAWPAPPSSTATTATSAPTASGPLVDWVNQCFPGVNTRQVVPWAGLRPMMPNMMPRVGQGRKANVFYNTGHGHLGWTLSAVTADMIGSQIGEWGRVQAPTRALIPAAI